MTDGLNFGKILSQLRKDASISQEVFAEKIGVSKQAIQKWESGKSFPDYKNLSTIAKQWNVSLDYLLSGVDSRDVEQIRTSVKHMPSYEKQHPWEAYYKELPIEYRQCIDEGKDIEKYKELINAISNLEDGSLKETLADNLYYTLENAPIRENFKYIEPSDYDEIVRECRPVNFEYTEQDENHLLDRIKGAWYGRICGCLFGKPMECIKSDEFYPFLKATDNYPISRYLVKSDVEKVGRSNIGFSDRIYDDGIMDGMPVDDDTNYTILALMTIEKYGRDFKPEDIAQLWLDSQPKKAYCTAERVAYHNFVNGYLPPESAMYKNPYREYIGAQIRGDFFGWINPGDPKTASEYAWRDASISHVKNGIYGEMWVSAMLAAACGGAEIKDSIKIGASYIPEKSRLYEAIDNVISAYESGITSERFFEEFHNRWDEYTGYDWCHTISNAEIVTASLLWGNGDYGKSICLAVQECFDTDCNAATVGSVVGIAKGYKNIPEKWKSKPNGTLFTSIFGYEKVSIDEMANKTMEIIKSK